MRSTLIRAVLVAVLALTTAAGLMGSLTATASTPVTATTGLNVRARPSTSAAIVGSLNRGQTVKARSDANGWTTITYRGRTAYVSSRYLVKGGELPASGAVGRGRVSTTTDRVNLRKGPGLTEDVVVVLGQGTRVTRTGKTSKGWTEVRAGSKQGWVSSQYLTDAGNGLPSVVGTRTTTEDLNVRASSDADSAIVGLARKGTRVSITGTTDNGRAQIVFRGAVGWVLARYLTNGNAGGPSAPPLPRVTGTRYATTDLMIRTTSGSSFVDLGDIPRGTKISITGVQQNKRAQIVWKRAVRWVTAAYLSKQKPTSGSGSGSVASPGVEKGLKPNALKVLAAVRTSWPQIRSIGGVRPDALPDHPSGRALDLMIPRYQSAAGKQLGHDLSRWLESRHSQLGINYIIWDQHIWNARRSSDGWRPMASRGSDSANHKNHVHVTVLAKGYAPI